MNESDKNPVHGAVVHRVAGGRARRTMLCSGGMLCIAAASAFAGPPIITVDTIVRQGQVIPSVGTVGNLPIDVQVNNSGFWTTTLPITGPTTRVILTPDGVHQIEGDVLDGFPVSSLANTHKSLNNLGGIAHRPGFSGSPNSGLVVNSDVLITQNQISTAEGFSADTPYIGFFRAKINDNQRMMLVATVTDIELPGTVHRALVWVDYDDTNGSFTETVLYKRYDPLPGQPAGVEADEFGTGSERFAINNNGDVIFTVDFIGGDAATNAAIYINDTLVAQKGDFGPFKDVTYNLGTSAATRVDINNGGDFVFLCSLSGGPTESNQVILRSSYPALEEPQVVIRKGDEVPGLGAGYVIDSLGTGAAPMITDGGKVIWYGRWNGPDGTEQGLFADDQLIVRSGVTMTSDGDVITTVSGTTSTSNGLADGFDVSENGRYIIARVVLNASTSDRAVVMIQIEDDCSLVGDLNCDGVVDLSDLLELLSAWGPCPAACAADLNDDGEVDLGDLLILLATWTS